MTWTSDCGTVRLILGDCLEVLPTIEAGSVDAVVTDPPFGVRDDEWDDMNAFEFARFSMGWMSQARRIAGQLATFSTQEGPLRSLCEMIYPRVRQYIWHKPLGSQYAGSSERKRWFAYEPIYHAYTKERWEVVEPKTLRVAELIRTAREKKGLSRGGVDMLIRGKKTGLCYRWEEAACIPTLDQASVLKSVLGLNGELDAALVEAYSSRDAVLEKAAEKAAEKIDVLSYRTVTCGEHPCEKPVELMVDLIETTTEPHELVCEPFLGSGTTGVACVRLGRRFIGIEREPKYFEIARRRIIAELNRQPLFVEPKPTQKELI